MALMDVGAERAVLAGICTFGCDAYFDVADIVNEDTFVVDSNSILYKCLKHILEEDKSARIDVPTIYSAANILGLGYHFQKTEEIKHLQSIMSMPIKLENVRKLAAVIRKLQIAKLLHNQLEDAQDKLLAVKGNESIAVILGLAEEPIFDFTALLNNQNDDEPTLLTGGIREYIEYLMDNPVEQIGISSGYPTYDKAIGGGFRRGSISMIGARAKAGKSILSINIGTHVATKLKLPVLYLDTEMMKPEQQIRLAARLTETPIDDLETGQAGASMHTRKKVIDILTKTEEDKLFFYKNISGKPFEEILSIMRRWVFKNVGLNDDGTAKDCLIIYDYLKLMSSENLSNDLKEYQLLGFMMTGLHNFTVRYSLPVLSFIQLNRDGITKESVDAASGSDRIIWLCSNFSIYKFKSDDEIAESGLENGNRKLVPIVARHGAGLDQGDYIEMRMTGKFAKITEEGTYFESNKKNREDEFIIEEDNASGDVPFE